MKKLILILFLLVPMLSMAQEAKFMGLELGTDMDSFCNSLLKKGLKQTVDRFSEREFIGTFATYNNCSIIIKCTETSKKVMSAEVVVESVRNNKYKRDKAFDEILEQYKCKYGDKVIKYTDENDKKFLSLIGYQVECGDIKIKISKFGPHFLSPNECSLSIYYISKSLINNKEINTEKYSDDI